MSRYYKMEVDIDQENDGWPAELQEKLEEAGVDIDDTLHNTLMGHTCLTGGETEDEAHARFERTLGCKLDSRWLCLEYLEWDVQINNLTEEGKEEEE